MKITTGQMEYFLRRITEMDIFQNPKDQEIINAIISLIYTVREIQKMTERLIWLPDLFYKKTRIRGKNNRALKEIKRR